MPMRALSHTPAPVMAAPTVTMVMQSPSYVPPTAVSYASAPMATEFAAPQVVALSTARAAPMVPSMQFVAEPQAPQSLVQGIPDPSSISTQRNAYSQQLDRQLEEGSTILQQQLRQQTDYLHQVGNQQKRQYSLEVDQQMKSQEIQLVQQHNQQLLMLQQAAQQQKAALEQQANALLLDYNQRKASEDLGMQQYRFQTEQFEAQKKYSLEMKALQEQAMAAQHQVQQQQQSIARQAIEANQQAQLLQTQQLQSQSQIGGLATFMPTSMAVPVPAPPTMMSYGPSTSYLPPVTQMAPPTVMAGNGMMPHIM